MRIWICPECYAALNHEFEIMTIPNGMEEPCAICGKRDRRSNFVYASAEDFCCGIAQGGRAPDSDSGG